MSNSPRDYLISTLLAESGPLDSILGCGQYRDDRTLPVNNLSLRERRTIIVGARLSLYRAEAGGERKIISPELQQQLVRYILEAVYYQRNGEEARSQRVNGQLYKFTQYNKIESLTGEEKDMTIETTANDSVTEAAAPAKAKKVRKPAAVKKAAKNAEKEAGKKGAAKKVSKNAAANEDRKTRLAAKKKDAPERTRISDPSLTEVKLQKMADEGTQPKQAMQILALLKEGGRKMQLDALYKAMGKAITTKQPIERIFAFYKKALMDAGHITVTIAAQ